MLCLGCFAKEKGCLGGLGRTKGCLVVPCREKGVWDVFTKGFRDILVKKSSHRICWENERLSWQRKG